MTRRALKLLQPLFKWYSGAKRASWPFWLVEHLSFKRCSLRVIRVQGELVGHFWETDLLVPFITSFADYEKFTSLFWLRIIFPWTLKYKESIGESLRSVASLWLQFCIVQGRHMGPYFGPDPESHHFHDFWDSKARFKEDFSLIATLPRNVKSDS